MATYVIKEVAERDSSTITLHTDHPVNEGKMVVARSFLGKLHPKDIVHIDDETGVVTYGYTPDAIEEEEVAPAPEKAPEVVKVITPASLVADQA